MSSKDRQFRAPEKASYSYLAAALIVTRGRKYLQAAYNALEDASQLLDPKPNEKPNDKTFQNWLERRGESLAVESKAPMKISPEFIAKI